MKFVVDKEADLRKVQLLKCNIRNIDCKISYLTVFAFSNVYFALHSAFFTKHRFRDILKRG